MILGILNFATSQGERIFFADSKGEPNKLVIDVSSDGEFGFLSQRIARLGRPIEK